MFAKTLLLSLSSPRLGEGSSEELGWVVPLSWRSPFLAIGVADKNVLVDFAWADEEMVLAQPYTYVPRINREAWHESGRVKGCTDSAGQLDHFGGESGSWRLPRKALIRQGVNRDGF